MYPFLHVKFRKAFIKIICFWKKNKSSFSYNSRKHNGVTQKSELKRLFHSNLNKTTNEDT
jgi:hypothetical protein